MFTFVTNFLGGVWTKLLIIGGIAIAVTLVLTRVFNAGRQVERVNNLQTAVKVKDAQLNAAMDRPASDDDLDRILRDGTF